MPYKRLLLARADKGSLKNSFTRFKFFTSTYRTGLLLINDSLWGNIEFRNSSQQVFQHFFYLENCRKSFLIQFTLDQDTPTAYCALRWIKRCIIGRQRKDRQTHMLIHFNSSACNVKYNENHVYLKTRFRRLFVMSLK